MQNFNLKGFQIFVQSLSRKFPSYFFSQKYNLDAKWRDLIKRKFNKNFRENEVENASKFATILNENERILFVNFCEFRSKKISMVTTLILTKAISYLFV